MNLKKIGKVFTSKSVGTGPSSYKKRIYRAAVSQMLRNTGVCDQEEASHHNALDIRSLTTGVRSKKCVVRRFLLCANVNLHKP